MVQRALELSGAAESALVWPRFLAGTLGRGTERMYPFARVPTHPRRVLGASARGSVVGDVVVCTYHGRTVSWCFESKCLVK